MASYHEESTTHQVGIEAPDSLAQLLTFQPLSIATTEAVRARMGLDSLDQTCGSSGQMYDTEYVTSSESDKLEFLTTLPGLIIIPLQLSDLVIFVRRCSRKES
jgi:hypothetical protein